MYHSTMTYYNFTAFVQVIFPDSDSFFFSNISLRVFLFSLCSSTRHQDIIIHLVITDSENRILFSLDIFDARKILPT